MGALPADAPPPKSADIHHVLKGVTRDIRDMMFKVHNQGFVVSRTKCHLMIRTPPGARPKLTVFAPCTPSDRLGLQRVKAKLRRIGARL